MIISAGNNSELENIMLSHFDNIEASADNHLGQSWETPAELPQIDGYTWQISTMFGVKRALFEEAALTENDLLSLLDSLEWNRSSVYGVPAASVPFDFRYLYRLAFVEKIKRGWITLKAVWSAPDGSNYVFRQEMSGTQGYCMVYKYQYSNC